MTKQIQVNDDVHSDLMLLKRIKGESSISDLIRLLMELCSYNKEFFVRMALTLEEST